MSQHRKHRGYRTQLLVARWFAAHGWPHAESTGASRQGADVTGMADVAVEVKARRDLDPVAWVKQAEKSADGRLPLAVVRCNGQGEQTVGDWIVMLRLSDATQLLRAAGYGAPLDEETER